LQSVSRRSLRSSKSASQVVIEPELGFCGHSMVILINAQNHRLALSFVWVNTTNFNIIGHHIHPR